VGKAEMPFSPLLPELIKVYLNASKMSSKNAQMLKIYISTAIPAKTPSKISKMLIF
jgi:hypothetical protein